MQMQEVSSCRSAGFHARELRSASRASRSRPQVTNPGYVALPQFISSPCTTSTRATVFSARSGLGTPTLAHEQEFCRSLGSPEMWPCGVHTRPRWKAGRCLTGTAAHTHTRFLVSPHLFVLPPLRTASSQAGTRARPSLKLCMHSALSRVGLNRGREHVLETARPVRRCSGEFVVLTAPHNSIHTRGAAGRDTNTLTLLHASVLLQHAPRAYLVNRYSFHCSVTHVHFVVPLPILGACWLYILSSIPAVLFPVCPGHRSGMDL